MSAEVTRLEQIGIESVPPDDEYAHWLAGKRKARNTVGLHEEFGIESTPPDDDFALWVSQKTR